MEINYNSLERQSSVTIVVIEEKQNCKLTKNSRKKKVNRYFYHPAIELIIQERKKN